GRVVVKRNAVAEGLAIAREVVIVEYIEAFRANLHLQALLDHDRFGNGQVDVAVRRAANVADARAGPQIKSVEIGSRLESGDVKGRLIHIHRPPRLSQDVLPGYRGNALRLELGGKAARRRVAEVERHSRRELHA